MHYTTQYTKNHPQQVRETIELALTKVPEEGTVWLIVGERNTIWSMLPNDERGATLSEVLYNHSRVMMPNNTYLAARTLSNIPKCQPSDIIIDIYTGQLIGMKSIKDIQTVLLPWTKSEAELLKQMMLPLW